MCTGDGCDACPVAADYPEGRMSCWGQDSHPLCSLGHSGPTKHLFSELNLVLRECESSMRRVSSGGQKSCVCHRLLSALSTRHTHARCSIFTLSISAFVFFIYTPLISSIFSFSGSTFIYLPALIVYLRAY